MVHAPFVADRQHVHHLHLPYTTVLLARARAVCLYQHRPSSQTSPPLMVDMLEGFTRARDK